MRKWWALIAVCMFAGLVFSEDFTTASGLSFKNARVSRVEPSGVTIFHDGGIVSVPIHDLTEAQKKKYGLNGSPSGAVGLSDQESVVDAGTASLPMEESVFFRQVGNSALQPSLLEEMRDLAGTEEYPGSYAEEILMACACCYMLNENRDQYVRTMELLGRRFGASRYPSEIAAQDFGEECSDCKGTGKITEQCTACSGSGRCARCNGVGRRESLIGGKLARSSHCTTCRGSGQCSRCNGKCDTTASCEKCGGDGGVVSAELRNSYFRFLLSRISGGQFAMSPPGSKAAEPAPDLPSVLKEVAGAISFRLKELGVRNLAISKVYCNGSGVQPSANYIRQKMVGQILMQAPVDLVVADRGDLALLVKENQLQWMLGNGTSATAGESDALLMGEFLYDGAFSEALLSVRVVDPATTSILCAETHRVGIDADLASRLGLPRSNASAPPLYQLSGLADPVFLSRINTLNSYSLASVSGLPREYYFPARVFYCHAVSELVARSVNIMERELIYQLSEERELIAKALDSVAGPDGVLNIVADMSSSPGSPTFFIKAVKRDGGTLVAQGEFVLQSSAPHVSAPASGAGGLAAIGADDSLSSALHAYSTDASVQNADKLRFKESFVLSRKIVAPFEKARFLQGCTVPLWTWGTWDKQLKMNTEWIDEVPGAVPADGIAMFDSYLNKLIPEEQGSVDPEGALRASLVALTLSGCHEMDGNGVCIGALSLVFAQIAAEYTVTPDREPCQQYWFSCMQAFAEAHFNSSHPVHRLKLGRSAIDPYRGSFKWKQYDRPEVMFSYSVQTDWQGKYPGATTVVLDFTPMMRRMYKVNKSSREQ